MWTVEEGPLGDLHHPLAATTSLAKDNHHFVPQFYLRLFGSDLRRTNLFNLARERAIQDVGIKGQCYRHKFYGKTDELEDALMNLEDLASPVLKRMSLSRWVPPKGTLEREILIGFVALQLLRTPAMANWNNEGFDKLFKRIIRRDPRFKDGTDGFEIYSEDAVRVSLKTLPMMVYALEDLKTHLVCCSGDQFFITSDNPVFRYNQYCEGTKGVGVVGGVARGLQVFLPLSPSILLLLFDGWAYKVGNNDLVSEDLPDEDIASLNAMQVANAEENLYFSDWARAEEVSDLFQASKRYRRKSRAKVIEYEDVANPNSSLLQLSYYIPYLHLKLSFVSLRRDARRVPLLERRDLYRKDIPEAFMGGRQPPMPEWAKRGRVFRRLPE